MPSMISQVDFEDPQHLMITEIDIDQYVVPRQVKASELAAAIIKADDGELTLDYQAFDGLRYYGSGQLDVTHAGG